MKKEFMASGMGNACVCVWRGGGGVLNDAFNTCRLYQRLSPRRMSVFQW